MKTNFYKKNQIKYCSRDQNTNKSQPPKNIYDKMSSIQLGTADRYFLLLDGENFVGQEESALQEEEVQRKSFIS